MIANTEKITMLVVYHRCSVNNDDNGDGKMWSDKEIVNKNKENCDNDEEDEDDKSR